MRFSPGLSVSDALGLRMQEQTGLKGRETGDRANPTRTVHRSRFHTAEGTLETRPETIRADGGNADCEYIHGLLRDWIGLLKKSHIRPANETSRTAALLRGANRLMTF